MKSFLIFLKNGEIQEKKTNVNLFDITHFKQFEMYKVYKEHIVMYNNVNSGMNLTVLNFTTDRYNSDIGLIKIDFESNIKSLTLNNYIKLLEKEKYEIQEEDTDALDIANSYKDIITF
tara:strand:- start:16 stop:369 length:354 start_codon:yes stop_codon:yes gene_type:complete